MGALLKLPFFTIDKKMKFSANLCLTFHSWSPFYLINISIKGLLESSSNKPSTLTCHFTIRHIALITSLASLSDSPAIFQPYEYTFEIALLQSVNK